MRMTTTRWRAAGGRAAPRMRRVLAAGLAVPLGIGAVMTGAGVAGAVGTGGAAGTTAAGAVPEIRWAACGRPGSGLECGRAQVPLDHERPRGARIGLALVRLPASDRAHRLGSLFINPGGPGGSGVDVVAGFGSVFADALDHRYDIVGFDPRGIAASTPLVCFDNFLDLEGALAPWAFPVTAAEEAKQQVFDRRLAAACTRRGGAIIDHMSTADVARDLDLLRAAVGDPALNYLGFSYGTQIGSVYANLFPSRVGRMVLDGVLDPIAWTTGTPATAGQPFSTRLHSDKGAQATLDQFLARCDRAARDGDPATECTFGPRASARFDALASKLRAHPRPVPTYADLIGLTLGALYSAQSWPFLAGYLTAAEQGAPAGIAAARSALAARLGLRRTAGPAAGAASIGQTVEGFGGVACGDSVNPTRYSVWPKAAAEADRESGYFGRIWTWASSACQPWPGRGDDRYLGPWTARTANPVLVVGNLYDPATRYQGAKIVSRLLPNSRLLTYGGWGHTVYLLGGSPCSDAAISGYLLRGRLPAEGTVCDPEFDPFTGVGAQSRVSSAARAAVTLSGLPPAVRRAIAG